MKYRSVDSTTCPSTSQTRRVGVQERPKVYQPTERLAAAGRADSGAAPSPWKNTPVDLGLDIHRCLRRSISGGQRRLAAASHSAGHRLVPAGIRATTCSYPYSKWKLGQVVTMPGRQTYSSGAPSAPRAPEGIPCATRCKAPPATWS
jgi:hypothetical protein